MPSSPVIIIGGGVSGLAAAHSLHRRGIPLTLLESRPVIGGAARTVQTNGYQCEEGPNTLLLTQPQVTECLRTAGLLDTALDAAPQAVRRFVVQNQQLVALPHSPLSFLISPALSLSAKLGLAREWFISSGSDKNETLSDFVRRRLGDEFLREFVGPFVSGVYAGDPERLVVRHALPKLYRLEQEHGSLLRGALHRRSSTPGPKGRLLSWPGGLAELSAGLAAPLRQKIQLSNPVRELHRERNGFRVVTDRETLEASQVIVASDAAAATLFAEALGTPAPAIADIPYASMTVLHLGFPREKVGHSLDGFGVLISRARKLRTLGTLFSSTLFPGRAPGGHILLTAFIGGSLDPDAIHLKDQQILDTVLSDLRPLLKLEGEPDFHRITRWPRAIPQYERGHDAVLKTCSDLEKHHPGLHLIGNYRSGISLENNLLGGLELGKRLDL